MKYVVLVISLLVFCAGTAHAELYMCFRPERPLGGQFYAMLRDMPDVADPSCLIVPPGVIQEQQEQLIASTIRGLPASRYLKIGPVVGSDGIERRLAVEMSEEEKNQVDASREAEQVRRRAFADELRTQDYCTPRTLSEVSAKIETLRIAVVAEIAADHLAAAANLILDALDKSMRCSLSRVSSR